MPLNVVASAESSDIELVDWIDEQGETIAVVTRARIRAERLRHRSVAILVYSSDGRILVHRRADHKDVWPGMWDMCVGGVVTSGESFDHAAIRELAEEIGISGVQPLLLAATSFDDDDVRELAHVYRVIHDGPYEFNDGEIVEARLVTITELESLIGTESFVPDSLAIAHPLLGEPIEPIRWAPVRRVEFTIEPFVEGQLGPHVLGPVEAVRALGVDVELGPFGSGCDTTDEQTPVVAAAIVREAFANGATHVNLDVSVVDESDGGAS